MTFPKQDFHYTEKLLEKCKEAAGRAIKLSSPFKITFNGIIVSNDAVIVKGFYEDEMENLRQNIRKSIVSAGLSPDERYPTISCHMTVCRFRKPLTNRTEFLNALRHFNQYDFGTFEVSEVELVHHNWYDSKKELLELYHMEKQI